MAPPPPLGVPPGTQCLATAFGSATLLYLCGDIKSRHTKEASRKVQREVELGSQAFVAVVIVIVLVVVICVVECDGACQKTNLQERGRAGRRALRAEGWPWNKVSVGHPTYHVPSNVRIKGMTRAVWTRADGGSATEVWFWANLPPQYNIFHMCYFLLSRFFLLCLTLSLI